MNKEEKFKSHLRKAIHLYDEDRQDTQRLMILLRFIVSEIERIDEKLAGKMDLDHYE